MVRGFYNLLIVILVCHIEEIHTAILSRNKAIKSTSTYSDWIPLRAVDGSTSTDADVCQCCSGTNNDLNAWYELDLGKNYKIHQIDVIGRTPWGLYGQHFQGMQIMFTQLSLVGFADSPETTITEAVGNVAYVLPVHKYTRYVSLVLRDVTRVFTICELIVYGDCNDGEFGDYCENICHCDGDPCDKVTGICRSGKCLPGYYGEECDNECQGGTYGSGCTQQCSNCLNNVDCDKMNGNCPGRCSAGYQGANCQQECNTDFYGQDCLSKCGFCMNGQTCNHVTGICTNGCTDGYLNQRCEQTCIQDYYGKNCQEECGHCRQGTICLHTNGTCPAGCSPGYQGSLCITDCDDGTYGDTCQINCGFCVNGTACNKVSGICEQGCSPGYIGSYCYQPCSDGFYGDECKLMCGNCKGDTICNKINGFCENGCGAGYMRQLCYEGCDDGTYGESCVHQCGRCYNDTVCDKRSGKCNGCAEGFKGYKCDVEESPCEMASTSVTTGVAIAGGTAGTILLIEAIVGAVAYLISKRRQGHADRRSLEEVNPYEMPDLEGFTSEQPYELKQRSITTPPTENRQQTIK